MNLDNDCNHDEVPCYWTGDNMRDNGTSDEPGHEDLLEHRKDHEDFGHWDAGGRSSNHDGVDNRNGCTNWSFKDHRPPVQRSDPRSDG